MSLDSLAREIASDDDEIIWEDTPTLSPGQAWVNDTLFMTFPIDVMRSVEEGRGKNKHTVKRRQHDTVCVTSEREHFMYNEEQVANKGFVFPQTFQRVSESPWPRPLMFDYLEGRAPTIQPRELHARLRQIVFEHVEYSDEIFYDLIPLFIMGTYVYRVFPSVCYIHFNGTRASGKTQNMKLIQALAFNAVMASSMTPPSLFRRTAATSATVILDEAEHLDHENNMDIRQLLNSGYTVGGTAVRTEGSAQTGFYQIEYDVFSPKVLGSINPLDPVLQSRCIVVAMMPTLRQLPEVIPSDEKWASVRNQLYLWALQNAGEVARLVDEWGTTKRHSLAPKLTNRLWQISQLMIIMADHIGGETFAKRVIGHLGKHFETASMSADEADRQLLLLRCLPRLLETQAPHVIDGKPYWTVKHIHEVVSSYLDDDQKDFYRTRAVGRHLTSLNFRDRRRVKGGQAYHFTEQMIRDNFARRHIAPFDEDIAWLAGQTSYAQPSWSNSTPTSVAQDPSLDGLFAELNDAHDGDPD